MSIKIILRDLGLNEKEVALYMALLKTGRTTPGYLAKITKINRATVYATARSLQGKRLIAEDLAGKSMYLVALPLSDMKGRINEERKELSAKEALIDEAERELSLIAGEQAYPVPKMRFVPYHELREFLTANTRKWQKSAAGQDGVWWGFQDHTFFESYEDWIHSTWKTPEAQGCKGHIVSNVSEIERKMMRKYPKEMRNVRSIMGMKFQSTLWVAGEYVVMIMTHVRPHYLYEIHDPLMAANLREVCKTLWKEARE
jgi:hypothetical protein